VGVWMAPVTAQVMMTLLDVAIRFFLPIGFRPFSDGQGNPGLAA
jgi:hypothetical protein